MKINLDTLQLDIDDQIQTAEKVEHKYRISFANSCYLWPEEWEWAPRRPSTLGSVITQFSSVAQSCPTLCDPWTAACQASLSITNSWSLLKLTSIESVKPSNHLILHHPFLLWPSIFQGLFNHQSIFKWVNLLHQVAKVLEFQLQHQSFQWIFRSDFL